MPALITQPTRKSASDLAAEARIRKAKSGHASFAAAFASMKDNQADAALRSRSFVSGFGGASNLPVVSAGAVARKSEVEDLPEGIRRLAGKTPAEGLKLLAEIVRKSEADGGTPVSFTTDEAASFMGVSRERSAAIVDGLLRADLLIPRVDRMGMPAGYEPSLPKH